MSGIIDQTKKENLGPTYHWFHYPVNTDIDLKQLKEQIQEKTVSRETYRLEKEKKKKADKLVVEGDFYTTPQESSLVQNNNKIQVKKIKTLLFSVERMQRKSNYLFF